MESRVAVLMGSTSDLPKIENTLSILKEFGVSHIVRVMSAHRTPDVVREFVESAPDQGVEVIIAAAGAAAHLAGVVAAHTILPVIGIPVRGGALNGVDALLSTIQMPGGIPVATVGIGSGGATNAALLAIHILALGDSDLADKLVTYREERRRKVIEADSELQEPDSCA